MHLQRWVIERLRDTMRGESSLDLPHETAVSLGLRGEDDPHRGPVRLTRDALNAIEPLPDPAPPRPSRVRHGYVLKNGVMRPAHQA
jgi:hypothetical protein